MDPRPDDPRSPDEPADDLRPEETSTPEVTECRSHPMFASAEEAVEEIRAGRMIIVVDDVDRENEGDLICAAAKATPEIVNFMARYGRGLICVPMEEERLRALDLQPMVHVNTAKLGTPFTVSVDAIEGTSTGISAYDRAQTIRTLLDPRTRPEDLGRPGHIFPLM